MRGMTLVTGGSDGSVRIWCLHKMSPIHRLAAHDNSVTSLQFDDVRVVSGGCDGRVKVWDLKTGHLVRELSAPADAVWRVAFEDEKAVIMASRSGRTIMEVGFLAPLNPDMLSRTNDIQVWSFAPPDESENARLRPSSPASCDCADEASTEDGDGDGDVRMEDALDDDGPDPLSNEKNEDRGGITHR